MSGAMITVHVFNFPSTDVSCHSVIKLHHTRQWNETGVKNEVYTKKKKQRPFVILDNCAVLKNISSQKLFHMTSKQLTNMHNTSNYLAAYFGQQTMPHHRNTPTSLWCTGHLYPFSRMLYTTLHTCCTKSGPITCVTMITATDHQLGSSFWSP